LVLFLKKNYRFFFFFYFTVFSTLIEFKGFGLFEDYRLGFSWVRLYLDFLIALEILGLWVFLVVYELFGRIKCLLKLFYVDEFPEWCY
jgi:hypothetical protein